MKGSRKAQRANAQVNQSNSGYPHAGSASSTTPSSSLPTSISSSTYNYNLASHITSNSIYVAAKKLADVAILPSGSQAHKIRRWENRLSILGLALNFTSGEWDTAKCKDRAESLFNNYRVGQNIHGINNLQVEYGAAAVHFLIRLMFPDDVNSAWIAYMNVASAAKVSAITEAITNLAQRSSTSEPEQFDLPLFFSTPLALASNAGAYCYLLNSSLDSTLPSAQSYNAPFSSYNASFSSTRSARSSRSSISASIFVNGVEEEVQIPVSKLPPPPSIPHSEHWFSNDDFLKLMNRQGGSIRSFLEKNTVPGASCGVHDFEGTVTIPEPHNVGDYWRGIKSGSFSSSFRVKDRTVLTFSKITTDQYRIKICRDVINGVVVETVRNRRGLLKEILKVLRLANFASISTAKSRFDDKVIVDLLQLENMIDQDIRVERGHAITSIPISISGQQYQIQLLEIQGFLSSVQTRICGRNTHSNLDVGAFLTSVGNLTFQSPYPIDSITLSPLHPKRITSSELDKEAKCGSDGAVLARTVQVVGIRVQVKLDSKTPFPVPRRVYTDVEDGGDAEKEMEFIKPEVYAAWARIVSL